MKHETAASYLNVEQSFSSRFKSYCKSLLVELYSLQPQHLVPAPTETSPNFSLLTPSRAPSTGCLCSKSAVPDLNSPQTCRPGQPSSPVLQRLILWQLVANSSCATQPGLKCSPSQLPIVGLNFPPTSAYSGHSLTRFVTICLLLLFYM